MTYCKIILIDGETVTFQYRNKKEADKADLIKLEEDARKFIADVKKKVNDQEIPF